MGRWGFSFHWCCSWGQTCTQHHTDTSRASPRHHCARLCWPVWDLLPLGLLADRLEPLHGPLLHTTHSHTHGHQSALAPRHAPLTPAPCYTEAKLSATLVSKTGLCRTDRSAVVAPNPFCSRRVCITDYTPHHNSQAAQTQQTQDWHPPMKQGRPCVEGGCARLSA